MDDYMPPDHVMGEWRKHCQCCPECRQTPCDGVMAGGLCDNFCNCGQDDAEHWDDDEYWLKMDSDDQSHDNAV